VVIKEVSDLFGASMQMVAWDSVSDKSHLHFQKTYRYSKLDLQRVESMDIKNSEWVSVLWCH